MYYDSMPAYCGSKQQIIYIILIDNGSIIFAINVYTDALMQIL